MSRYDFVAVRHGVILAWGEDRAAAAAAAAAGLSRCETRVASPPEQRVARRIDENGRQRSLPDDERALLELIHIDISRLLCLDEDPFGEDVPVIAEYRAVYERHNHFDEWLHFSTSERRALERRSDAIIDELREMDALERQIDAFGVAA